MFAFSVFNDDAVKGLANALGEVLDCKGCPVIVCIGSDLVLGDSFGPLVGTFLKQKGVCAYVYGALSNPLTAKEIRCATAYIKKLHPKSPIIAVDAAVGLNEDVGLIKLLNGGLRPGLGLNKELGQIGDVSIMGIVSARSVKNSNFFNLTRLGLVYRMAEMVSEALLIHFNSVNAFAI